MKHTTSYWKTLDHNIGRTFTINNNSKVFFDEVTDRKRWCYNFLHIFMAELNHQIKDIMEIKVKEDISVRKNNKDKYVFNFKVSYRVPISSIISSTSTMMMVISLPLKPYEEIGNDIEYLCSSPSNSSLSDY